MPRPPDPSQLGFDPEERLRAALADTLKTDAALVDHLRNQGGERIPSQLEDWVQLLEDDEVVSALDDRARARVLAIRRALDRVERGIYGLSVDSGEPIEIERLRAIPWAERTAAEAWESDREPRAHAPLDATRKAESLSGRRSSVDDDLPDEPD